MLTREITNFSHPIKCYNLPPVTFIKNRNNEYYSLNKAGQILKEKNIFPKTHLFQESDLKKAIELTPLSLSIHILTDPAF